MKSVLAALVCASALFGAAACGDHDAPPAAPSGSGATGAGGAPPDPASLRVEFEELSLDTEPTFITDFVFYPGSDTDFLALDKSGQLLRFEMSETSAKLVSKRQVAGVYDNLDCGAISLAFEPDLAEGNYLYVGTCSSLSHSEVLRLDLDDEQNVVEGSEVTILRVGSTGATRPWHNVGSIGFEPGGVLWALFGEKVQGAPSQDLAQDLGKLLRVVPSREPGVGGFEPAPDGPLVDSADAAQSVFALGLRSPFRGTRDSRGFYWIGDVGSDAFEEINVTKTPLTNFGWPDREGPCSDCGDSTTPAFFWERGAKPDYIADDPDVESTLGRVAWAGPEVLAHQPDRYGGRLAGSVLFGDFCAGFLRQGRVDDDGIPSLDAPLGHLNNVGALRQHSDGFVYAITFGRCQTDVKNKADEPFSRLYRMLPKD
ncbi:MAG TPA: PQQ-dependent sugar dehydrogenase [Polyangiaceae bacterium]|nr:PQQ-dependent sugar dehydrogenase [Polyangiaceae bacterium]